MVIPLLLAAAVASPASAAAGSPPSAEVSTAALAAANLRLSARCAQKSFDVDAVLADGTLREDLRSCPVEEARVLGDYAACRAVQGAPQACAALIDVGSRVGEQAVRCRARAAEDRFIFLTLRGGDALAACRSLVEASGQPGLSITAGCSAGIAAVRAGDVRAACPALERANFISPQQTCEDTVIFWSGSAEDCERASRGDPESKRECRRRAALVAGLREPAKCARSPACLALVSKSPEPCDALAAGFSRMLCSRVASDLAVERRSAAQAQALRAAQMREESLRVERLDRERAAKASAASAAIRSATVDAAAAAVAAARAKVDEEDERVKKKAAGSAREQAAAEAAVRAKAAVEARKEAEAARARGLKTAPQFGKNEPMNRLPPEAVKVMEAIEAGRPIPEAKPKPKPKPKPKKTRAAQAASEEN